MATSLPILTFHALDEQSSDISFSPELFRRGMAKLYKNGCRTLSLLEAIDCLRQRKPFAERSFVITFDDGYQTVYDEAFSVLQRFDMSATVFLTVGEKRRSNLSDRLPSLNGRPMLNWNEILEMHRFGITFGAHTLNHPDLIRLPADRIRTEIYESMKIIEDALNTAVTSFAYPYGRYDHRIREIVQPYFACACSDKLGFVHAKSDLYALERVDAYYLRTERLFDIMLTGWFPLYIRARHIPRWIRRAIQHNLI
jgi:peptidoglycan/xylan/chitin deacetylase (PgdA/CDA1 family)